MGEKQRILSFLPSLRQKKGIYLTPGLSGVLGASQELNPDHSDARLGFEAPPLVSQVTFACVREE